MWRGATAAVLLVFCLAGAASAQAPAAPPALLALNSERGRISLLMYAPPGARVTFFERTDAGLEPIGEQAVDAAPSPLPSAYVEGIAPWRCDRLVRRFTSVAVALDGARTTAIADVRTPDCAGRLGVLVPARVARGALLPVAISDRFTLGVPATACAIPAGGRKVCKDVQVPAGGGAVRVHFRTARDAVTRVRVRSEGRVVERVLTVGDAERPADAAGLPNLVVTGDSLIQGIDAFLADRLQTAYDVTSDTRPGTGLVKQSRTNWPALAEQQVKALAPAVTVLSLGVNDGQDIGGRPCCSATWSAGYATKARKLMRTYARGGRGRVLWLIAPTPKDPRFAEIASAVATGIRAAAAGQEGVRLVDLAAAFTPGGVYRDDMTIAGRRTRVRAQDGVHLSVAGSKYAAGLVAAELARPE